jgi:hypothetical protein
VLAELQVEEPLVEAWQAVGLRVLQRHVELFFAQRDGLVALRRKGLVKQGKEGEKASTRTKGGREREGGWREQATMVKESDVNGKSVGLGRPLPRLIISGSLAFESECQEDVQAHTERNTNTHRHTNAHRPTDRSSGASARMGDGLRAFADWVMKSLGTNG